MDTRAAGGEGERNREIREGERSRETETGGEVMMGSLEVNQRKRVFIANRAKRKHSRQ